jgi:hydrogenase assembly chaperone HypC/HupF
MCLTVPCEVVRVEGDTAVVARAGAQFAVSLLFLDQAVRPGDWIAVQAQRHAHAVLTEEEARDILDLYARLDQLVDRDGAAHG